MCSVRRSVLNFLRIERSSFLASLAFRASLFAWRLLRRSARSYRSASFDSARAAYLRCETPRTHCDASSGPVSHAGCGSNRRIPSERNPTEKRWRRRACECQMGAVQCRWVCVQGTFGLELIGHSVGLQLVNLLSCLHTVSLDPPPPPHDSLRTDCDPIRFR